MREPRSPAEQQPGDARGQHGHAERGAQVHGCAASNQRIGRVVGKRQRVADDEHDSPGNGNLQRLPRTSRLRPRHAPQHQQRIATKPIRPAASERLDVPGRDCLERTVEHAGQAARRSEHERAEEWRQDRTAHVADRAGRPAFAHEVAHDDNRGDDGHQDQRCGVSTRRSGDGPRCAGEQRQREERQKTVLVGQQRPDRET